MRQRPWNGVRFSEDYLSSLEGMGRATEEVLVALRAGGAEPIVESKVRSDDDLQKLENLLRGQPARETAVEIPEPGVPPQSLYPASLSRPRAVLVADTNRQKSTISSEASPVAPRRRWQHGGR